MKKNPVKILLIAEDMLTEKIKALPDGQIFLLNEDNYEKTKEFPYIYKYQSAESIIKTIMSEYAKTDQIEICKRHTKKSIEIIGIYSPVGRCLQTSFALVLGQLLTKNKKVLYINLEAYSGFRQLLQREFEHDIIDLLYFLNGGREKFIYKLGGMIESIGQLDFIPPALSFPDLSEIEGGDWQIFLEEIEAGTDYEVVLLDLSDSIKGLFDILMRCHKIYTITKPDGLAMSKLEQYEMMLGYAEKAEIIQKTKKVNMPVFKEIPESVEKLTYSALAGYVRELLKEEGISL